jgi:hypothetical protein
MRLADENFLNHSRSLRSTELPSVRLKFNAGAQ